MKMLKYISALALLVICAYSIHAITHTQRDRLVAEAKNPSTSDQRVEAIYNELQGASSRERTNRLLKTAADEVKGIMEDRKGTAPSSRTIITQQPDKSQQQTGPSQGRQESKLEKIMKQIEGLKYDLESVLASQLEQGEKDTIRALEADKQSEKSQQQYLAVLQGFTTDKDQSDATFTNTRAALLGIIAPMQAYDFPSVQKLLAAKIPNWSSITQGNQNGATETAINAVQGQQVSEGQNLLAIEAARTYLANLPSNNPPAVVNPDEIAAKAEAIQDPAAAVKLVKDSSTKLNSNSNDKAAKLSLIAGAAQALTLGANANDVLPALRAQGIKMNIRNPDEKVGGSIEVDISDTATDMELWAIFDNLKS